jgi:anaerobic magnesium-protoporphyrin IX monomethyl ester cyclase
MTTSPPEKAPWIHGRRLPPLGIAYVAAALEKAGHQVQIIDNYLLEKLLDQIKHEIEKLQPEIVGIACGSVTYQKTVDTAKAVKEVLPTCKVIVGGPHPSYMPDSMMQHPEIDFAVLGEGERVTTELVNLISNGKDQPKNLAKIAGIGYREKKQTLKTAPSFINDLDQVPFPARHLLPMSLYDRRIEFLNAEPVDTMNVIRGCPFNCTYCDIKRLWGRTCRAFSSKRVVDEISHLVTKYATKGIYFVGDNFTINTSRTEETCRQIREQKLDIEWICDTRVDLVSRKLLKEMKSAGCRTIWFGVESGSPRILEKVNRGITVEQAQHAFKICREEGINTACSFMLGTPGETVTDMKATFNLAKKLNADWCQFNIFIAYPGSPLYDEIMQCGLYDRVEDFVAYVKTDDFNYEMLLETTRQFQKSYNLSTKRILRKIRREGFLKVLKESIKLLKP